MSKALPISVCSSNIVDIVPWIDSIVVIGAQQWIHIVGCGSKIVVVEVIVHTVKG